MKHSELRHQPRHVNPRIQDLFPAILPKKFIKMDNIILRKYCIC